MRAPSTIVGAHVLAFGFLLSDGVTTTYVRWRSPFRTRDFVQNKPTNGPNAEPTRRPLFRRYTTIDPLVVDLRSWPSGLPLTRLYGDSTSLLPGLS